MQTQRSNFTALPDKRRRHVREAALTIAQQGLRRPMVEAKDARPGGSTPMIEAKDGWARKAGGAPNTREIPDRPQRGHPTGGQQSGTYNSSSTAGGTAGSTDPPTGGGVELMARVIVNQSRGPDKPHPQSTQKPPPWPRSSGQPKAKPMMPRRRRS